MTIKTSCLRAALALIAIQALLVVLAYAGLARGQERPSLVRTWEAVAGIPLHSTDRREPAKARQDRLLPVAAAVAAVSGSIEDSAALLALAHHESHLAGYVGRDECGKGPRGPLECDRGQSRGYWQLQRATCPAAWQAQPSPERLELEAACALAYYRESRERCGGTPRGGLAGYRGRCETSDAALRERTFHAFSDVLARGWPKPRPGWERDPKPAREARRLALEVPVGELRPGAWVAIAPGVRGLVEWHWHDFGGEARPRGWHLGISLYRRAER